MVIGLSTRSPANQPPIPCSSVPGSTRAATKWAGLAGNSTATTTMSPGDQPGDSQTPRVSVRHVLGDPLASTTCTAIPARPTSSLSRVPSVSRSQNTTPDTVIQRSQGSGAAPTPRLTAPAPTSALASTAIVARARRSGLTVPLLLLAQPVIREAPFIPTLSVVRPHSICQRRALRLQETPSASECNRCATQGLTLCG